MKAKFYYCKTCGNVIVKFVDSGVTPVCCSESMVEMKANTVEGVEEKHIPVVVRKCLTGKISVCVGEKRHPMVKDHWIEFIALETDKGLHMRRLKPECKPCAKFILPYGETLLAVYAYCNVHGLWVKRCEGFCPIKDETAKADAE